MANKIINLVSHCNFLFLVSEFGNHSFKRFCNVITQTHGYAYWANAKSKKEEYKLFVEGQMDRNNWATHAIAFVFFNSPNIYRFFHDF